MFANPFAEVSIPEAFSGLTYGHVNGPRFNSKKEIQFLQNYCDAISQTCGPEVILANELELPYVLLGFGVDYANGVTEPTPIETLNAHMAKSKEVFTKLLTELLEKILLLVRMVG